MKYFCVISVLVFLQTVSIGASSIISAPVNKALQIDKKTEIKANLRQAKYFIDQQDYESAKAKIDRILVLDPSHVEANELLERCNAELRVIAQKIKDEYAQVCKKDTKEAFETFITSYPNSEFCEGARKRIQDMDLWKQAEKDNTISSYTSYLSKSTVLAYKELAQARLESLRSEEDWKKCKDSNNETLLTEFLKKYPSSLYASQAKYQLNIVQGERYFSQGYEQQAFDALNEANSYSRLTGQPAQHLQQLQDKRLYDDIMSSYDKSRVKGYLRNLSTTSPYYDSVSNKYAVMLAKDLNKYSNEYSFNEVLSYARDNATYVIVKSYIDNIRDELAKIEHARVVQAHKAWWKDRVRLGWNIVGFDANTESFSVRTGLRLRFGRHTDAINFIFGCDYVYQGIGDFEDFDYSNLDLLMHQLALSANLRFNLIKCGKSKIYLGCELECARKVGKGYYYFDKAREWTNSFAPQLGFNVKHFDIGVSYRKYLKDRTLIVGDDKYGDAKWGGYMIWYF